jgi:hypothetical protein
MQFEPTETSDETLLNIETQIAKQNLDCLKHHPDVVLCSGETHISSLFNLVSVVRFGSHIRSSKWRAAGIAVMFSNRLQLSKSPPESPSPSF